VAAVSLPRSLTEVELFYVKIKLCRVLKPCDTQIVRPLLTGEVAALLVTLMLLFHLNVSKALRLLRLGSRCKLLLLSEARVSG